MASKNTAARIAELESDLAQLTKRHQTLTEFVGGLRDDVVTLREVQQQIATRLQQDYSRAASLKDRIEEVRFQNDKREESQTLRDQSNVQSLVNLRESTQKGFDQVKVDIDRLNKRTTPPSATDQAIVNSKLDSLYRELNERLTKLEAPNQTRWNVGTYQGMNVYVTGRTFRIGENTSSHENFFILTDDILSAYPTPWGFVFTVKGGDQFILTGGPDIGNMVLNLYKKA